MPRHLTQEERDRIAQLFHQGYNQQEIANELGRNASTISRELFRNRTGASYLPSRAQQMALQRRQERPLTRKLDDAELNLAVRQGLARDWSPEQIAGRLRVQYPDNPEWHVSHQTIYDWIEEDPNRDHWKSHPRKRGRRPPRPKNEGKTASLHASIKDRPEEIELRIRIGDWEGDTVLGPPGTGGIVTLVDRKSRYTIMTKIQSKDSEHVHARIKQRLRDLIEEQLHSVTFDNGTEFARCHRLEKHLGMELYFAEPGCSYQRGTNENTNGLIRQYFPKGTDFRDVSHHEVRRVEALLNDRP
jgi:IS30 family transposase